MPKIKIAVIEDDQSINNMYSQKFKLSGYDVLQAYDGKAGWEMCQKEKPAILLLDLKIPHLQGDELLKKVRETEWGAMAIVFILTNFSKDEAPSTLRFLNVEHYFIKAHYTPAQIHERIEEAVKKYNLA